MSAGIPVIECCHFCHPCHLVVHTSVGIGMCVQCKQLWVWVSACVSEHGGIPAMSNPILGQWWWPLSYSLGMGMSGGVMASIQGGGGH